MGLTAFIVVGGVKSGIEKWSVRLMPTLVILILALIVRLFLVMRHNSGAFYSTVSLLCLVSGSLASAVSVIHRAAFRATERFVAITSIFLLFAGYLRKIPDMSSGIAWLTEFSFGRWHGLTTTTLIQQQRGQQIRCIFRERMLTILFTHPKKESHLDCECIMAWNPWAIQYRFWWWSVAPGTHAPWLAINRDLECALTLHMVQVNNLR